MRSLLSAAGVILLAVAAFTIFQTGTANAAVCADGVYRAGCAGPRGAVVVRKPVPVCRTVWVDGIKVKRCS